MNYNGETFRGCTVALDGNTFEACTFKDVTLDYGGGPTALIGCDFDGVGFRLTGNLERGLETLRQLHHDLGSQYVDKLVNQITAILRRKDPPTTFIIH